MLSENYPYCNILQSDTADDFNAESSEPGAKLAVPPRGRINSATQLTDGEILALHGHGSSAMCSCLNLILRKKRPQTDGIPQSQA